MKNIELLEETIVLPSVLKDGAKAFVFSEVPTLDFLMKKHIFKYNDSWEPVDNELVIQQQPPFMKTITFRNGIKISSDFDRLQIVSNSQKDNNTTKIAEMATKIIDKLEGVEYAGCGINFAYVHKCELPNKFAVDNFIKHIPQIAAKNLVSGDFSYVYEENNAKVTVKAFPAKQVKKSELPINEGLFIHANYHFEVVFAKKIQEFIKSIETRKQDFTEQVKSLVG